MSIAKAKGLKGKCDGLVSKIVRATGACENCGSKDNLQCAHIISRRYVHTRTCLLNLVCLCARCHFHFTINPVEWGKWVMENVGEQTYDELYREAQKTDKFDWQAEYERLKEIWQTTSKN